MSAWRGWRSVSGLLWIATIIGLLHGSIHLGGQSRIANINDLVTPVATGGNEQDSLRCVGCGGCWKVNEPRIS